jgi:hypothetical protein
MRFEAVYGALLLVFALAFVGLDLLQRMRKVYARPRPDLPVTPQELARQLLDRGGLRDVTAVTIPFSSDTPYSAFYDEARRLFAVSPMTANARSVIAYAFVARESSRMSASGAPRRAACSHKSSSEASPLRTFRIRRARTARSTSEPSIRVRNLSSASGRTVSTSQCSTAS